MFFLFLGIIETIATIITFFISIKNFSFYSFLSLSVGIINCIALFKIYDISYSQNNTEDELQQFKESLNECRKKLKLPIIKEKKEENCNETSGLTKEEIDKLPTYNPYFNPYIDENGINIDETNQDK